MIPIDESNAASAAAEVRTLTDALSAPFDPREVKFKPQAVKGTKALAIAYVDVRLVEDRLDQVVGVEHWQDEYDIVPDGSVVCRLRVKLAGEWVTKTDVGSPSEQPDGGDRLKAAFSDALKRAAVKFGIGRYLYRLPAQWVDYDPAKKQIVRPPQLPAFALPAARQPQPAQQQQPKPQQPPAAAAPPAAGPKPPLPETGAELYARLEEYDAKLARKGVIKRGGLVEHVRAAGQAEQFPADFRKWTPAAIRFAVEVVKEFQANHPTAA